MSTTATSPRLYTPEDLLAMPEGDRYELVDGHLVESNVSGLSSWVGGQLYASINEFCRKGDLGWAWPADNHYRCFPWKPGLVRKPDVSFIRRDRLDVEGLSAGVIRIAPDLAVEIISPNDLAEELEVKLRDYRRAGVRLVWVVFPEARCARVHRLDKSSLDLDEADELDGGDVLPGFRCRISALFPVIPDVTR